METTAEKRYRPFSNGMQHLNWENANCCCCKLYSDDAQKCSLMRAIARASIEDGTMSEHDAGEIGYIGAYGPYWAGQQEYPFYIWSCLKREREGLAL